MKRLLTCIHFVLITGACFALNASAGEIFQLHQKQLADEKAGADRPANGDQKDAKKEITEIGVEHTMCFGACPAYTLIIKDDGTFRYHGEQFVDRKGDFTGSIDKAQWKKLIRAALDCDFMTLNGDYSEPETDLPSTYTTVVIDGRRHTIRDYGAAGPEKLRNFESLISNSLKDAKWDEKK